MKEIRISDLNIEKRENGAAAPNMQLTGRAIVFNTKTLINSEFGRYYELIKPEALSEADISDTRLLINHNEKMIPLAKTPKTLKLSVDKEGLLINATLPDTEQGRSLYQAVKRGDINKMSFAFTIAEGGDKYDPQTQTRTITKIKKLYEVSAVSYPAYPQTSLEARDIITAANSKYKQRKNLIIKLNKLTLRRI